MTFEHPLGRISYADRMETFSTVGSLGGPILNKPQKHYLTYATVGTIVGAVAGSWYGGGAVVDGRSNDVWGGMVGMMVGSLAFIAGGHMVPPK